MKERVMMSDIGDAPYALTVARSLGSSSYCVEYNIPLSKGPMKLFSKFCHRFLVYPDLFFNCYDRSHQNRRDWFERL